MTQRPADRSYGSNLVRGSEPGMDSERSRMQWLPQDSHRS
jgi:hypothetical protein